MLYRFFLLVPLLLGLTLLPQRAQADAQASWRGYVDFGQRRFESDKDFIYGLGMRGDVMFGRARPRSFRVGPALELRTVKLKTAEAALGAGVLIPMPGDMPIGLYGLLGSATRKGDLPDGAVGIGTVTWGFRGYNYHSWYGYAINAFFSARKHLGDEDLLEMSGGIEVDFVFSALIPSRAMLNFIRRGDPYDNGD